MVAVAKQTHALSLAVSGYDCPSCLLHVERELLDTAGVQDVVINSVSDQFCITLDNDADAAPVWQVFQNRCRA